MSELSDSGSGGASYAEDLSDVDAAAGSQQSMALVSYTPEQSESSLNSDDELDRLEFVHEDRSQTLLNRLTCGLDPRYLERCAQGLFEIDPKLTNSLIAIEFKSACRMPDKWYQVMRFLPPFIPAELAASKVMRRKILALTNFQPRLIDCCVNSCCAFVNKQDGNNAEYADLEECPFCSEARYEVVTLGGRQIRRARKSYSYIPVIPRLLLQYAHRERAELLRTYRQSLDPGGFLPSKRVRDYFDGSHFASMRSKFSDPRTLAFSLSTDGITFVRQRGFSTWPILMQNLSLPPAERVKYENMILVGMIPGPKNCKDMDSFLVPLLEELQQLVKGILAYDAYTDEDFTLKGYLCVVSGDTPAIAKLMCMSGHNGTAPCRFCKIRGKSSRLNRHQYYPHTDATHTEVKVADLRLRINLKRDYIVVNGSGSREIQQKSGILGMPILLALEGDGGLSFPNSFGQDAMHLVSNVTSLMYLHWSGKMVSIADYVIPDKVWTNIGNEQLQCRQTLPSAIVRTPRSIAVSHRSYKTKEWEHWLFIYSLPLLRGRLWNKAYAHWSMFVRAMYLLFQKEITHEEIDYAERLLEAWVRMYEEIYYQGNASQLSACRSQIHYLLHMAQNVRTLGPLFCYWQYPVERYIGQFERWATSKSQINVSLMNNIVQRENIAYLRYKFQSLAIPTWKGVQRPGDKLALDLPDTQGAFLLGPYMYTVLPPATLMMLAGMINRPLTSRSARIYSRLLLPHLRYHVGSYAFQKQANLRLSCYVEVWGWNTDPLTRVRTRAFRYARVEKFISYKYKREVWTVAEIRWIEHKYDSNIEMSFVVAEREMDLIPVDDITRIVGLVSGTRPGDKPGRRTHGAIHGNRTKLWIVGPNLNEYLYKEDDDD